MPSTPSRPASAQRKPAKQPELDALLRELNIHPPGKTTYHLVSEWAAKHVWRVDVDGHAWAFVRYLLGAASHYPDRWRHMRLGQLLHEARVGPRVLGMTPESEALRGRAALVEAGLNPIPREELEDRVDEAVSLITRLHSNRPLFEALAGDLTDVDIAAFRPVALYLQETHERWFTAVTERWQCAGLEEIDDLLRVVNVVFEQLDRIRSQTERLGLIVPAHNDLNYGNFMVNRQGMLRMIDFEEMSLNNPVADLGIFLTWYVDKDRHLEVLSHYPLADPRAILNRMKVWVPLRYLNIAAHWAARLTRARSQAEWVFAVDSIDEWLRGACELVFRGDVPDHLAMVLADSQLRLMDRDRES